MSHLFGSPCLLAMSCKAPFGDSELYKVVKDWQLHVIVKSQSVHMCKDSYGAVLQAMMAKNIPVVENGVIHRCLGAIAPNLTPDQVLQRAPGASSVTEQEL